MTEATHEVSSGKLQYSQGYHDGASIVLSVIADRNEGENINSNNQVEKFTDTNKSTDQENFREEELASNFYYVMYPVQIPLIMYKQIF